jgi:uncharacterized protein YukE
MPFVSSDELMMLEAAACRRQADRLKRRNETLESMVRGLWSEVARLQALLWRALYRDRNERFHDGGGI